MGKIEEMLKQLPELKEAPWGKKIPAFAEWKITRKNSYPETDNYAGFVYGKNSPMKIIYFSPFALGERNSSPNTSFPAIDVERIIDIEERKRY